MRKPLLILTLLAAATAAPGRSLGVPPPEKEKPERELYVPFEDLNVLLEGETRRVLLTREQFGELLEKARKEAQSKAPLEAVLTEADYHVRVGEERAEITGSLAASVLEKGLHTLGLDASGVGIRRAALDGRGAPIGLADDGRLMLFIEGVGRHELALEMVTPLQTTAARQLLSFQVPVPTAARMRLTVPGDVEVVSGAAVVSRVFEEAAEETRFVLLPKRGPISLVMTLNSRLKRRERVVIARSVLVDEVTQAYERLHATISLSILHRAVDAFRFAVPEGFEITDVHSPRLARWAMVPEADGGDGRVLEVHLREEATDTVVVHLSAVRSAPDLGTWRLPQIEPLETVGHVAVVGLLLEDRLQAGRIATKGLIPIDNAALVQAIPPTVLQAEPGAPTVRPVVAYYAPQPAFDLSARFEKPPARLLVTTNLLLVLQDGGLELRGGFAVLAQEEKVFSLDFSAPPDWDVMRVTGEGDQALAFERYDRPDGSRRVHVRLPQGVPAGEQGRVFFHAEHVPDDWFDPWDSQTVSLPTFAVLGATRDVGAVAVDARDDMRVQPETLEGLAPLDENEKAQFGLAGVGTSVAYRYESRPYTARLAVERTPPRLKAETYSFLRIDRDALFAHYELVYEVEQARARRLSFILPEDTPLALSITGLDGTGVKEYRSEVVEGGRRWTVLLARADAGTLKLAVDFQQPLGGEEHEDLALPTPEADGVEYQSGFVAVEGSPELVCEVTDAPRRVDVGELVDAKYQPGKRLLGAYVFVGKPEPVRVRIERPRRYFLPPAIVERAELVTLLSTTGLSQNAVRLRLRTKATFVQVRLPEKSALWSVTLDGRPVKPQQEGESVLVGLSGANATTARDLTVVYETPVEDLGFWEGVELMAPRLLLHDAPGEEGYEVPVANLVWHLDAPADHRVVSTEGSVVAEGVEPIVLAATRVAEFLYAAGGGIDPGGGLIGWLTAVTGDMSAESRVRLGKDIDGYGAYEGDEDGRWRYREMDRIEHFAEDADEREASAEMPAAAARPTETPPPPVTAPRPSGEPPPPPEKPEGQVRKAPVWALAGARSLKIDLTPTGRAVTFRSLGAEPEIGFSVVSRRRLEALSAAFALAVLVAGLAMTNRPVGHRIGLVAAVLLVTTLLPAIPSLLGLALVLNGAFYVACLLVPYYLAAALVKWAWSKVMGLVRGRRRSAAAAAATLLVLGAVLVAPADLRAQSKGDGGPYVIQVVPPPEPVKVPADAVILPYDPASKEGIEGADRLLVPYDRFVELWNLAYPDERLAQVEPPADYALAGAGFTARLEGDEYLLVEGRLDLDVFTDEYAQVPLPLEGGVLARADLDGKPARLSVATLDPQAARQSKARPRSAPRSFVVLYATGKGRHRLDVAVRMKLQRQGGWRVAQGRLPAAPATALELRIPEARTEVRLGAVPDRRTYETKQADETIATALDATGELSVQWRPTVSEGQIDKALTVVSDARFDVQEDQLRVAWDLGLNFRRGEREFFSVDLPQGYLVEKVAGTNVRGWEVRQADGRQKLEVGLLKAAKGTETFSVHLWRAGPVPADETDRITVPVVDVAGAIRHTGRLVVRRSPLLDVRTEETSGARRTDLPQPAPNAPGFIAASADESPLGIRPYQAYEFVGVPFTVRLSVRTVAPKVTAEVQTILRIAEREHRLESRVLLGVQDRPIHRARVLLPAGMEVDEVSAPGGFEWGIVKTPGDEVPGPGNAGARVPEGEQLLTVYFTAGLGGSVPILIRAHTKAADAGAEVPLPRLEVLDVDRQQGDLVVQADPAYDVRAQDLVNLERVFLKQVAGWLVGGQRDLARLALRYKDPDYAGRLALVRRTPKVSGYTVTNVRVTDRAIEETILVVLEVREAGIREIKFRLPAHMAGAEVRVPLLRHKTVDLVPGEKEVRVTLELQDEVMDELRIAVENDRLLTPEEHAAPIPVLETGTTERRYVALESSGRDEVNVVRQTGLETLGRRQREWETVAPLLRGGATDAFIVVPGAAEPALVFRTVRRPPVEGVGARIGLGKAVLYFDSTGAYQGVQTYHVSNSTEQFLVVKMPDGARLWTAWVAGRPVKPGQPDPATPRRIHIPLVKTARGELDYAVVLKYGGRFDGLGSLRTVGFPLIQTINITVERPGAELYLPRTHAWFWFGGKLTPETQEGDLQAQAVSYYADQIRRQEEALQASNEFAQVRALTNLKALKASVGWFKYQADELAANPNYRANLGEAEKNLRDVVQTADKAAAVVQQADAGDNRMWLNDFVEQQDVNITSNAALDIGGNWDASAIHAGRAIVAGNGRDLQIAGGTVTLNRAFQSTTFNDAWLVRNKLQTDLSTTLLVDELQEQAEGVTVLDGVAEYDGKKLISNERLQQFAAYQRLAETQRGGQAAQGQQGQAPAQIQRSQSEIQFNGYDIQQQGRGRRGQPQAQPAAPQISMGDMLGREVDEAAKKAPERGGRRDQRELVARYQKQLEAKAKRQTATEQTYTNGTRIAEGKVMPDDRVTRRGLAGGLEPDGTGRLTAGTSVVSGPAASGEAAAPGGAAGVPPAATGLVSVDVAIAPQDRGRFQQFTFTGPQVEEVTITAWTASDTLVAGLKRLVVVVLAVATAAALRRLLVGRKLTERGRRVLATALILVGLASVLFGILPAAGWLVLVAGIAWKVVQVVLARRRAIAAAA